MGNLANLWLGEIISFENSQTLNHIIFVVTLV